MELEALSSLLSIHKAQFSKALYNPTFNRFEQWWFSTLLMRNSRCNDPLPLMVPSLTDCECFSDMPFFRTSFFSASAILVFAFVSKQGISKSLCFFILRELGGAVHKGRADFLSAPGRSNYSMPKKESLFAQAPKRGKIWEMPNGQDCVGRYLPTPHDAWSYSPCWEEDDFSSMDL